MWYGIAPEGKSDFDLGFVALSYQQIGISIMAIAVTFPLNVLWITMFRKARVKGARKEKKDNSRSMVRKLMIKLCLGTYSCLCCSRMVAVWIVLQ